MQSSTPCYIRGTQTCESGLSSHQPREHLHSDYAQHNPIASTGVYHPVHVYILFTQTFAGGSLLRRTQCHSLETTCNRCYWRKLSAATRNTIIEHFLFLGGFSISIPNLDFEQTNLGKRRPWCQTFFHVIKSYQVKSQLNIWFGL